MEVAKENHEEFEFDEFDNDYYNYCDDSRDFSDIDDYSSQKEEDHSSQKENGNPKEENHNSQQKRHSKLKEKGNEKDEAEEEEFNAV